MIVTVTLPEGATGVRYGAATLLAAEDRTLDVPDFVAKAILEIPGVTGPAQKSSVAALLGATHEPFELAFIFHASGQQAPRDKYEPVLVERAAKIAQPIIEEHRDPETGEKSEVISSRLEVVETGEVEMVETGEQKLVEAVDLKDLGAKLLAKRGEPVAVLI